MSIRVWIHNVFVTSLEGPDVRSIRIRLLLLHLSDNYHYRVDSPVLSTIQIHNSYAILAGFDPCSTSYVQRRYVILSRHWPVNPVRMSFCWVVINACIIDQFQINKRRISHQIFDLYPSLTGFNVTPCHRKTNLHEIGNTCTWHDINEFRYWFSYEFDYIAILNIHVSNIFS